MNVSTFKKDRVFLREVCLDLLVLLDTPVSLSIYLQIEYNLSVETDVLPSNYLDPISYQKDIQALAIFKKNPWFFTHLFEDQLRMNAEEKFLAAEAKNLETNKRLRDSRAKAPHAMILHSARQWCAKILGSCTYSNLGFSPGASTALKGKEAHILGKLRTPPHSTHRAWSHVIEAVLADMPHYALACGLLERDRTSVKLDASKVLVHDSNVFESVPKDWRSDRGICIEPPGNMLLQKGYGAQIRDRLRLFGYDLETLQEKHGELARVSSLTDSYSTIDLASASDTVSREFVREVLPNDWYNALDILRCQRTTIKSNYGPSTVISNEKFSSMGNGFTFELETLLFLCIGLAVREIHGSPGMALSVYGDDIIIDKRLSNELITQLTFLGLSVNSDKTFIEGPFKESCGYDYLNGLSVRPVFIKELPEDEILQLVAFANRIREISHCAGFNQFCDSRFRALWRSVVQRLPINFRFFGPRHLGDEVISATLYESRKNRKTIGNVTRIKTYFKKPLRRYKPLGESSFVLCAALYGVSSSGVIPRGVKYLVMQRTSVIVFHDDAGCEWR